MMFPVKVVGRGMGVVAFGRDGGTEARAGPFFLALVVLVLVLQLCGEQA